MMNFWKYLKQASEAGILPKALVTLFLVTQFVLLLAFFSMQGYWRAVPVELPALPVADYPLPEGCNGTTPDNKCFDSFAERRARLARVCKDQPPLKHEPHARNIRGNRQAGLTVCIVYKAASTVWMRMFFLMNRKDRSAEEKVLSTNKWEIHYRYNQDSEIYDLYSQRDIIMRTHRGMTTRNPYSRLWSAYVDKFLFPEFFEVGKKIIKRFRVNATETEIACGHDVTFEEFIRYVVDENHNNGMYSDHWLPASDVCDPCTLRPDFIAKQETLGGDIKAVVQHLGLPYETDDLFVKTKEETTIRDDLDVHMRYYDSVKQCMTKTEYLRRIWTGLVVNGYLQPNTEFQEMFEQLPFKVKPVLNYIMQMRDIVTDSVVRNKLRQKALATAFQRIPDRDLIALQRLYKRDFLMFDYSAVSFL